MSALRGFKPGQSWSSWKSKTHQQQHGDTSWGGSSHHSGTSSPLHSPRPPSPDDVMKLPKRDMHIFGRCPVQDEFTLVVCDRCGNSYKVEAFESHYNLRHASSKARKRAEADLKRPIIQIPILPKREIPPTAAATSSASAAAAAATVQEISKRLEKVEGLSASSTSVSSSSSSTNRDIKPEPLLSSSTTSSSAVSSSSKTNFGDIILPTASSSSSTSPIHIKTETKLEPLSPTPPPVKVESLSPTPPVTAEPSRPSTPVLAVHQPVPSISIPSPKYEPVEPMEEDPPPFPPTTPQQQGPLLLQQLQQPVSSIHSSSSSSSSSSNPLPSSSSSSSANVIPSVPPLNQSSSTSSNTPETPSAPPSSKIATLTAEEADSTTPNNVISIPDNMPLPDNIGENLMDIVNDLNKEASDVVVNQTAGMLNFGSESIELKLQPPNTSNNTAFTLQPPGGANVLLNQVQQPLPLGNSGNQQQPSLQPQLPTIPMHPIPQSQIGATPAGVAPAGVVPPAASGIAGKNKQSPGKKKGNSRDREYDPDRHCGVWDPDAKRHCTRALTCKSHSVLLKRKIEGRSKKFDELVAAHKAVKEAAAAAANAQQAAAQVTAVGGINVNAAQVVNRAVTTNQILQPQQIQVSVGGEPPLAIDPARIQLPPSVNVNGLRKISAPWETETSTAVLNKLGGINRKSLLATANITKEIPSDENLHYTTDHPKPLAVCTFGGRRMGGLLVTDRSQILTRKVVRVAITAGGFQRIRPKMVLNHSGDNQLGVKYGQMKRTANIQPIRTQQGGFVVNYSLSGTQINPAGSVVTPNAVLTPNTAVITPNVGTAARNIAIGGGAVGAAGGPHRAVKLTTLQPGGIVLPHPESFSTDIQDLKGGFKFELGRKIKHILPSGSEVTK